MRFEAVRLCEVVQRASIWDPRDIERTIGSYGRRLSKLPEFSRDQKPRGSRPFPGWSNWVWPGLVSANCDSYLIRLGELPPVVDVLVGEFGRGPAGCR